MFLHDKCDFHLTLLCSDLLRKDLLKRGLSLAESFFKHTVISITLVTQGLMPSSLLSRPGPSCSHVR